MSFGEDEELRRAATAGILFTERARVRPMVLDFLSRHPELGVSVYSTQQAKVRVIERFFGLADGTSEQSKA